MVLFKAFACRSLFTFQTQLLRFNHSLVTKADIDGLDDLYEKLNITLKGHERAVLSSYNNFLENVANNLELNMSIKTLNRPVFDRYSLNKSPFINKKHQRQYEIRTFYKFVTFSRVTGSTSNILLEYLQRNLPEGVSMDVEMVKLNPLSDFLITKLSSSNRSNQKTLVGYKE